MKRFAVHTLGCKTNQYDSQAMAQLLQQAGWSQVAFEEQADIYIVNTCTVTNISDRKSRQMIRRAASRGTVIAAGCLAQRNAKALFEMEGVMAVVGNQDRSRIVELAEGAVLARRSDIVRAFDAQTPFEELKVSGFGTMARADLKVQEGCDRYCTYCTIPFVRGPVRSRELENIRTEAKRLADSGCGEIVLTGIHLESYGADLNGPTLADAMEAALASGVRIRLGSLEPMLVTDTFLARLAQMGDRVCPHFHLSLQSGSLTVLRRMGRRYTPEQYFEAISRLRQAVPGCAITTDIMAGFPGETEQEHEESCRFMEACRFARAHVFPYSQRPGTRAAAMPDQLPLAERTRRAGELIGIGKASEAAFLAAQVGQPQDIVIEYSDGRGTTQHSMPAVCDGASTVGTPVRAVCTRVCDGTLVCRSL